MDKEWDEFTSCPVCFEDYEEKGNHIPRLLPCSHTLCDKCVRELKHGKRITCPQDRQTHETLTETHNFPQNNYILKQIHDEKKRGSKSVKIMAEKSIYSAEMRLASRSFARCA